MTLPSQPRTYDSILNDVISRVRVLEALPGASAEIVVYEVAVLPTTYPLVVGDLKTSFAIPEDMNNWQMVDAQAYVQTVGSTTSTIQIRNRTTTFDMLTVKITVDASDYTSYSATTPSVIDPLRKDVVTADMIAVDIDGAGTGALGLGVILTFTP